MVRPLDKHHLESGICSPIHREWRGRIMSLRPVRIRTGAWMQDSFSLSSLGHLAIRPNSWRLFTALSLTPRGSGTFSRPRQRAYFIFTSISEAALMPLGRAFPLTATTADTRPG